MSVCSKIPYETLWSAELALRAIQKMASARGLKPPTGAYFCSTCHRWHLTSKSKTRVPQWARHRCSASLRLRR